MRPTIRIAPYLLRLVALAAALALLTPAAALADNTVSAKVVGGDRSARASEIRFDQIVVLDGRRYQFGEGKLVIDDASGTNAGWRVALAAPGAGVVLTAVSTPRLIVGQAIDAQAGPAAPSAGALGQLDTPRTVVAAAPGFGKGRYELIFTVVRELPAKGAGNRLTLTVTITPAS